jgi:hypothetical protein
LKTNKYFYKKINIMKKLILSVAIVALLFGCNSNTTSDPTLPISSNVGSIKYKVNGAQLSYTANASNVEYALISKQLAGNVITKTRYVINAQQGSNNIIQIGLVTDSLKLQNYTYDSAYYRANIGVAISNSLFNGTQSTIWYNGDYLNVNITSYSNGIVNGTFTAKLTPISPSLNYNTRGSVLITEGEINNLKVTY